MNNNFIYENDPGMNNLSAILNGDGTGYALKSTIEKWSVHMDLFIRKLESFMTSTESEFLAVGISLRSFHKKTNDIQDKYITSVIDLISGEEAAANTEGINSILGRMSEYIQNSEKDLDSYTDRVTHILKKLESLSTPLGEMHTTARSMRKTGFTAKVWTAPLTGGDNEFRRIADDFRKMSEKIGANTNEISDALDSTGGRIRKDLSMMINKGAAQKEYADKLMNDTRETLASFIEKKEQCKEAVNHISDLAIGVTQSIEEVVTSLQFHDITFQEVDKEKKGLSDLRDELVQVCEKFSAQDTPELSGLVVEASDMSKYLSGKLKESNKKIVTAVNVIKENLKTVAQSVTTMSNETLKAAEDTYERSLLSEIDKHFLAFVKNAQEIRELLEKVGSVKEIIGEISSFVRDIETIDSDIEIIALNSKVKAVQIGESGKALEVVADAIISLCGNTNTTTQEIVGTLAQVVPLIEELTGDLEIKIEQENLNIKNISNDLEALMNKMLKMNNDSHKLLLRIDKDGQLLSKDLEKTARDLKAHDMARATIGPIISELDEIIAYSGLMVPDTLDDKTLESTGDYDSFEISDSSSYLQGERLDDNVELF